MGPTSAGIGYETALHLARNGWQVKIACRDLDKGRTACQKIKEAAPGATVAVGRLDLADLASVKSFAEEQLQTGQPLGLLINNAGVMACPEMRTKDGFELQLGVNHLGHFALTAALFPLLKKGARIINVSSSAHQVGKINFDDLQSRRSYGRWKAYGQSKLANVLFTYELNRRLPPGRGITANALHPGVVATELQRHILGQTPSWWQTPLLFLARPFVKSPEQGALTSCFLATSPEVEGVSGKYFSDSRPVQSSKASYDTDVARQLWEVSEELTGTKFDFQSETSKSQADVTTQR